MLCEACEHYRFPFIAEQTDKRRRNKKGGVSVVSSPADVPSVANSGPVSSNEKEQTSHLTASAVAPLQVDSTPTKLVVNELLAYTTYYRDRANVDALRGCVSNHFTPSDITDAKKTLISEFQSKVTAHPSLTERRGSSARSAHEAELDDILTLLDHIDRDDSLHAVQFVAADFDRLPKYGPEETNIGYVIERHVKLDATVTRLTDEMTELKEALTAPMAEPSVSSHNIQCTVESAINVLLDKFDVFQSSINARIDYLNTVCTQLHIRSPSVNKSSLEPVTLHNDG
jgi:hypothetical protein